MNDETIRILLIENKPDDAELIQNMLSGGQDICWDLPPFEVEHTGSLEAALARLDAGKFDVVLASPDLSDGRAGEAIATLRERIPRMPLVMLMEQGSEELARDGVCAGLQDCLCKEKVTANLLACTVMYAVERQQSRQALREAHDTLERRVEERTAELRQANEKLQAEIRRRERVEKELRDNEAELSAIISNAPFVMMVLDRERRIREINRSGAEFAGRPPEEILGVRSGEALRCIHALDDPRGCGFGPACQSCTVRRTVLGTISTGDSHHKVEVNMTFTRQEGEEERTFLLYTAPLTVSGERRVLVVFQDITERKRAEKKLESEHAFLSTVFDNIEEAIVICDEEGRLIRFNEAARQLHGLPERPIPPDQWTEHYDLYRADGTTPLPVEEIPLYRALQGEHVHKAEIVVAPKHGSPRSLVCNGQALVDESGIIGAVVAMHDITERKQMEEALQERVKELTCLYAVSRDLQEGLSMGELCRRVVEHLVPAMQFPEITVPVIELDGERFTSDRYTEGLSHGLCAEVRVEGEVCGRVRVYYTEKRPFLIPEEQNLVNGVAEALSTWLERRQAEEKLERYAAELERSNRDLQQFAYAVSHDLREPVRMVEGYLKLLERRYRGELDEKADEFISHAVDGAERMQEMIRALLDLSRVGTRGGELTPTDAGAVLERTLRSLGRMIEDTDAEVTHDSLPTVMADATQLDQVFQNLIANALKFRREDVPPRVHISAEREGDEWLFSVADNGIGIDPEQADRIFRAFQRLHTEEEYPGLGIGLALCKRIVERHGGRIWVESEPGQGSTFYFTLST